MNGARREAFRRMPKLRRPWVLQYRRDYRGGDLLKESDGVRKNDAQLTYYLAWAV